MVYLLTGICDVTKVVSRRPWSIGMRMPTVSTAVDNFMINLDKAHREIYSLSAAVGHHIMIITPTLTGVDLGKYNKTYPLGPGCVSPLQRQLNNVILSINQNITAMNISMQISTPFLATPVHPRCRRRNRFVTSRLVDGCHPTSDLCASCADKIFHNVANNADKYSSYVLANTMY